MSIEINFAAQQAERFLARLARVNDCRLHLRGKDTEDTYVRSEITYPTFRQYGTHILANEQHEHCRSDGSMATVGSQGVVLYN